MVWFGGEAGGGACTLPCWAGARALGRGVGAVLVPVPALGTGEAAEGLGDTRC